MSRSSRPRTGSCGVADGTVWRENRVAKRVKYLDGRAPLEAEIAHNVGRVCYDVPAELIEPEERVTERSFA